MSKIGQALANTGHSDIAFLTQAYREAEDRYAALQEKDSLHAAQLKVARAAGDTKMVAQLDANPPYETGEFANAYLARRDAAKALCEALNLDPSKLRWALT